MLQHLSIWLSGSRFTCRRADWMQVLENALHIQTFSWPSLEELLYMLDRQEFDRLVAAGHETGKSFISLIDMNKLLS